MPPGILLKRIFFRFKFLIISLYNIKIFNDKIILLVIIEIGLNKSYGKFIELKNI